jgi:GNAT superfamily N-acetyltransferase
LINPVKALPMMTIRQAATVNIGSIVQLFHQLGYDIDAKQVEEHLIELHHSASGKAFLAEEGQRILGVAIVHFIKPLHVRSSWALISALVVDGEHRGSGVGAALLTAAERYALPHGCSRIELSSNSTRTRAHTFYEGSGYQEKRLRFVKILA